MFLVQLALRSEFNCVLMLWHTRWSRTFRFHFPLQFAGINLIPDLIARLSPMAFVPQKRDGRERRQLGESK